MKTVTGDALANELGKAALLEAAVEKEREKAIKDIIENNDRALALIEAANRSYLKFNTTKLNEAVALTKDVLNGVFSREPTIDELGYIQNASDWLVDFSEIVEPCLDILHHSDNLLLKTLGGSSDIKNEFSDVTDTVKSAAEDTRFDIAFKESGCDTKAEFVQMRRDTVAAYFDKYLPS